jgi:hypothetical protein
VPVTLGVGIFQDGSLGPQSIPVLKELRRLVREAVPRTASGVAGGAQRGMTA